MVAERIERRGTRNSVSVPPIRLSEPERAMAERLEGWCPKRPKSRADCVDGPRPCPWVGCKFNLIVSVRPESGSLVIERADLADPLAIEPSCVLDVAGRGPNTLEQIAQYMGITRERVRQVENRGKRLLKRTDFIRENR